MLCEVAILLELLLYWNIAADSIASEMSPSHALVVASGKLADHQEFDFD